MKRLIFTMSLLVMVIVQLSAQPGGPPSPMPFGFVEVLIGAGAVFGGYKAYKQKANK